MVLALHGWGVRNWEPHMWGHWRGRYRSCNLGSLEACLGSVPTVTDPAHFLTLPSGVFDKVMGPRITVAELHLIKLTEVTPTGSYKCSKSQLHCLIDTRCAPACLTTSWYFVVWNCKLSFSRKSVVSLSYKLTISFYLKNLKGACEGKDEQ